MNFGRDRFDILKYGYCPWGWIFSSLLITLYGVWIH
jgi:hypothetical protein